MPLLRHVFLCLVLLVSAPVSAKDEKLKVAFIYRDAASVPGWSHQHDLARKAVEKFFDQKVEVTVVDNLRPGPDAERVVIGLARANNSIIFVTAPELAGAAEEAAKRFPDIYFEIAQGEAKAENISTYDGRFYEARYVMGKVAASESESDTLGFVATAQDVESVREINAFMLGAQSVKPGIILNVAFTGEVFTPADEAKAARAVIAAGADVIAYNTHTPATAQIAEQNGVKVFGDASDMSSFAPQMQIGALIHDWSGYYVRRVSTVLEGKWTASNAWMGVRDGIATLSDFTNVGNETRTMGVDARQKMIDDKLKVFTGPVLDKGGTERIKKDEVAGDDVLKSMDWFVRGNIRVLKTDS